MENTNAKTSTTASTKSTTKKHRSTKKASEAKTTHKSVSKKAATAKKTKEAVRTFVDKSLRIVKLVKDNPRKKGTFGFKSFSKIKNGMTVEAFQEAGGRLKDMHWDVNHGYLKLAKR